ncbi:MAG TPA: hypothetical protein ENH85_11160 [Candidatus Scalindua sp.]|nr:hypothetical protein [Candidatus Scalindua sp.]
MPTPEEIEESQANAYYDYLDQQSGYELAVIFHYAMCKLQDKDGKVRDFDRKCWLINMIRELDYSGEHDVSGFEDIRREV